MVCPNSKLVHALRHWDDCTLCTIGTMSVGSQKTHVTVHSMSHAKESSHCSLTGLCDASSAKSERVRVEAINAKLQALARELQKDNKLVHERSQAAFAAEEQKRKDLQDSFQKTAGDISARYIESNMPVRSCYVHQ